MSVISPMLSGKVNHRPQLRRGGEASVPRFHVLFFNEQLPVVTGVSVSEAGSSNSTPSHTQLVNLPRFMNSRARKLRRVQPARAESPAPTCSFMFRPTSQGLVQSASDASLDLTASVESDFFAKKRSSESTQPSASLPTLTKTPSKSIIPPVPIRKRVKLVVHLPKPHERSFDNYVAKVCQGEYAGKEKWAEVQKSKSTETLLGRRG